jgi:hypothetical protein
VLASSILRPQWVRKSVSVSGVWPNLVRRISLVDPILRPFRGDPNTAARLPSGTQTGRGLRQIQGYKRMRASPID